MSTESSQLENRESQYSISPTAPTIYYARTDIVMAHFSEDDLDSIASTDAPMSFGFLGICIGVFTSFLGILLSTDIASVMKHATCIAITVSSGLLSFFFVYKTLHDLKEATRRLTTLKKRFGSAPGQERR